MKTRDYQRMLYEAKQDLARHLVKRQQLDERIARLQAVVVDLQTLCAEQSQKNFERGVDRVIKADLKIGITESVRVILQEKFFPMTAVDLLEKVKARKYNLARYKNPLAVIHTVLKRLIQSGDVRVVGPIDGLKAYQWITSTDKALSKLQESSAPSVEERSGLKEPQ